MFNICYKYYVTSNCLMGDIITLCVTYTVLDSDYCAQTPEKKLFLWKYCPYTNGAIPAVAWNQAWVCGRSLAGTEFNPAWGTREVCPLWVLCVVQVGVGLSPIQRSPTVRDVSNECDHEDPQGETMTRNRVEAVQEKKKHTSMWFWPCIVVNMWK